MHQRMENWAERLNLTAEQAEKIKELQRSFRRETLGWRNELAMKRSMLREMLRDPGSNPEEALGKQREISGLESKIQERALLYRLEVRKVLTPEQLKLLPPGLGWGALGGGMMRAPGRGMGRE